MEHLQWNFFPLTNDNTNELVSLPLTNSSEYSFGYDNASLIIRNVRYSDQGLYSLRVSTKAGTAQASTTLFINGESINTHEHDQSLHCH